MVSSPSEWEFDDVKKSLELALTARSTWHDICYRVSGATFAVVIEIPKGSTSKCDMALGKEGNPIEENLSASQRLKKMGSAVPMNYGFFPQTYCDSEDTGLSELNIGGDAAPLDAIELSGQILETGAAYEVVVLGAFCMIDKGELDWKILTLRTSAVFSKFASDASECMDWFKTYADIKKCEFPFGLKIFPPHVALQKIEHSHMLWKACVQRRRSGIWFSPMAIEQCCASRNEDADVDNDEPQQPPLKAPRLASTHSNCNAS